MKKLLYWLAAIAIGSLPFVGILGFLALLFYLPAVAITIIFLLVAFIIGACIKGENDHLS